MLLTPFANVPPDLSWHLLHWSWVPLSWSLAENGLVERNAMALLMDTLTQALCTHTHSFTHTKCKHTCKHMPIHTLQLRPLLVGRQQFPRILISEGQPFCHKRDYTEYGRWTIPGFLLRNSSINSPNCLKCDTLSSQTSDQESSWCFKNLWLSEKRLPQRVG